VHENKIKVVGASQVIVFKNPQHVVVNDKKQIKFDDVHMSIYTDGDTFSLQ